MIDALLVTPYYDPNIVGGAEISTQLIAEGVLGRCDVLTFGATDARRSLNGVTVYEMAFPKYANLWAQPLGRGKSSAWDNLRGQLRDLRPNVASVKRFLDFFCEHRYKTIIMNSNEFVMDRPSLWQAAHKSGARVILTLRDNLLLERLFAGVDYSWLYTHTVARQLRWIDQLVAPSQYMIDLYAKHGMTKESCRVIPNAVKAINVPDVPFGEKRGVLYAGSISEQKGIRTLAKAASCFSNGERLVLIGRGPLAEEIAEGERIVKCGWMPKDDLYREMSRAKVLVLPSEWPEAFGRVLIEAVQCGTLVVGSTAGGIPEVLGGDERYLFKSGDIGALTNRVNRILGLAEDEYLEELAALRLRFERYAIENYVAAWGDLIG